MFSSYLSIIFPLSTYIKVFHCRVQLFQHHGLSEIIQENVRNHQVKCKQIKRVEGNAGALKWQITVIHHNIGLEMHWTSSSHMVDIYESNSVQRCDLTLRRLEGCCLKWDFHCCRMPEVRFRLCIAHSSWPLISQQRPSACTKAALILCFHS